MDACGCYGWVAYGDANVRNISCDTPGRAYSVDPCDGSCVLGHVAARLVLHRGIMDMEKLRPSFRLPGPDLDYRNAEAAACQSKPLTQAENGLANG